MSTRLQEIDVRRLRFERCAQCGRYHVLHPEVAARWLATAGATARAAG
ncbi:MAG: hypothetical protein ACJ8J0_04860 [Longimicrobiaceae bacterium]